jgi:hypothetical protein
MNLSVLTPTVPPAFAFLLDPQPPATWGLEYLLVERAAHYLSAFTLLTTPSSYSVRIRACGFEDGVCQTLVTTKDGYCSIHKPSSKKVAYALPAEDYSTTRTWQLTDGRKETFKGNTWEARAHVRKFYSIPDFYVQPEASFEIGWTDAPYARRYPLGDLQSYGRDAYPQWSFAVERSLNLWINSQEPPSSSDPNYGYKENITHKANRKHIKKIRANGTEHLMVGHLQRMQQTSTENFYTVENSGLVERELKVEDSPALEFDDELKENPDRITSGASSWFPTSRVFTEFQMRHERGTYFKPIADYRIDYEVSQGLPNVETMNTIDLRAYYEEGPLYRAAQQNLLSTIVPVKGKRFNTPSSSDETVQGSRRTGDWHWFLARLESLEESVETKRLFEKWEEEISIAPEPFMGQHFVESQRDIFPDLRRTREELKAVFNPRVLTRSEYEAEVRKHRDFEVHVQRYHHLTRNTPYIVQVGGHNVVKVRQQVHRAGERAE